VPGTYVRGRPGKRARNSWSSATTRPGNDLGGDTDLARLLGEANGAMNVCPNPDCSSLRKLGTPAEYRDGFTVCADCGSRLERRSETRQPELPALPKGPPRGVPIAELGAPRGELLVLARMKGEHGVSIFAGVLFTLLGLGGLVAFGNLLVSSGGREWFLYLMMVLMSAALLLGLRALFWKGNPVWTVRDFELGITVDQDGKTLGIPYHRLLRAELVEIARKLPHVPVPLGWDHVLRLRWDTGEIALASFEPYPGLLRERKGDDFQRWATAVVARVLVIN
jgi:hypothetical protein